MTTLEQAVKSGIKILEKEASKKISETAKNKTRWRNRKIISAFKWKRITAKDKIRMLDYIPDDYVEPGGDIYFEEGDATLTEEQHKWFKDYSDYLEHTKNPKQGKELCEGCILNQGTSLGSIRNLAIEWAIIV